MEFVAIDVETASANPGSICQLGLAFFAADRLVQVESHLVRPTTAFAAANRALHGIGSELVANAPTWDEVYAAVRPGLHGKIIVSHTMFDRRSIFAACCRGRSAMFSYVCWLDSYRTARNAWPDLDGYSLSSLARQLGLSHQAHDAGEDARVAGQVYLLALQEIARKVDRKCVASMPAG
jgi:DNA polymerase-3 subunit epsilon